MLQKFFTKLFEIIYTYMNRKKNITTIYNSYYIIDVITHSNIINSLNSKEKYKFYKIIKN